jgi:hypothetical protein
MPLIDVKLAPLKKYSKDILCNLFICFISLVLALHYSCNNLEVGIWARRISDRILIGDIISESEFNNNITSTK